MPLFLTKVKTIIELIKNFKNIIPGVNPQELLKQCHDIATSKKPLHKRITDTFINFVEKYKGVRRIILTIILYLNIHAFYITCYMYVKTQTLDSNWIIYTGYWVGLLATMISFYTLARNKEFISNTPYSPENQWISSEDEGADPTIKPCSVKEGENNDQTG